jgi:putative lipoic acid-binding regulatory protein
MNNPGKNGGENGEVRSCNLFGKESVKYPVKFDLKAIIDAGIKDEDSIAALEEILNKHKVPFSNWRQKASSGGKYISYTVSVEIENNKLLEDLYTDLKKVKGLKFAL